jgi:hypothetical protein
MYCRMIGRLCEWLIKKNMQESGRGHFWRHNSQRMPKVNEAFLQGENLTWIICHGNKETTWKQDTMLLLVFELVIIADSHE